MRRLLKHGDDARPSAHIDAVMRYVSVDTFLVSRGPHLYIINDTITMDISSVMREPL